MKTPTFKKQSRVQQQIFNTLYLLRIVITNARLYSIEHLKTKEIISKAHNSLVSTLRLTKELTILIIDNDLIINDKAIRAEEADYFTLFITILKQKGIEYISFKKGVTHAELTKLLSDLSSPLIKDVFSCATIVSGKLKLKGVQDNNPSSEQTALQAGKSGNSSDDTLSLMEQLSSLSNKQLLMAQELYFSMRKKQDFDLRGIENNMSSFVSLFSKNLNPLSLLTNLKTIDDYTFTHVINVCILTLAQAESLGFSEQYLYDIGITATLYDIGKTLIPEDILNKPEKLTPKEQQIIKTHARVGAGYLLKLDDAPKLSVLASLEHHIRFDGNGYPNLGKEWKPNIVSQMIAIADTYDAMRCSRPYRKAIPEEVILKTLTQEKGRRYHPFLVDNFIAILSRSQTLTH